MIPEKASEFLKQQIFIHVGTRDAKLRSKEIMSWGFSVNHKEQALTVFIPAASAEVTLNNLKDNGQIAVTFVYLPTHDSLQFKGRMTEHRTASVEEISAIQNYVPGFVQMMQSFGLPETMIQRMGSISLDPSVAVTFRMDEIFIQTPGPDAGKKIFPVT